MKKVTICKRCNFAKRWPRESRLVGLCLNEHAPVSEFVTGLKKCSDINKGKCKFYLPWVGYAGNSNKGDEP